MKQINKKKKHLINLSVIIKRESRRIYIIIKLFSNIIELNIKFERNHYDQFAIDFFSLFVTWIIFEEQKIMLNLWRSSFRFVPIKRISFFVENHLKYLSF